MSTLPSVEAMEVPPAWESLDPENLEGTVLVIGAVNRGKSTLVRWLVGRMAARGRKIGWLDGDIGQSTLGIPTTMNLAVVESLFSEPPGPRASFFVGATSPRGHMLPLLVGLQRLREHAWKEGAQAVVIDTTGLVAAEAGGAALKEWKIELLRPQAVIAVQREGELEHLLTPLRQMRGLALFELSPAVRVRERRQEERAARRCELFRDYFSEALPMRLTTGSLPVFGREKARSGRLMALLDEEGFALGLGVLETAGGKALQVYTPWRRPADVSALRFGDLRLDPDTGEEIFL